MGKVISGLAVSVDGYITGRDPGAGRGLGDAPRAAPARRSRGSPLFLGTTMMWFALRTSSNRKGRRASAR
ncbi:hypothetical protein JOF56_010801 [Kibdelosporangium banguiense]|uniref:Dihydrofolate reductase n=1 Tax=Kibdelosporangium banguiense TaxID=1365924 RepID=A0ABS4U2I1_9PSEU|nr:hypothetical protein [Kibdelosporangium banguiense]